jgi:hypothetical protein
LFTYFEKLLKPAYPQGENGAAPAAPAAAAERAANSGPGWTGAAGRPYGQLSLDTKNGLGGTGAHGIEYRDGLLYFAVPPSRMLYVMDPKTWVVQAAWPLPGNRPHGVGWDRFWWVQVRWVPSLEPNPQNQNVPNHKTFGTSEPSEPEPSEPSEPERSEP